MSTTVENANKIGEVGSFWFDGGGVRRIDAIGIAPKGAWEMIPGDIMVTFTCISRGGGTEVFCVSRDAWMKKQERSERIYTLRNWLRLLQYRDAAKRTADPQLNASRRQDDEERVRAITASLRLLPADHDVDPLSLQI